MIVLRLIGLFLDLLLLPLRAARRGRIVRSGSWLEVTIDGSVVDLVPRTRLFQLRREKATSLHTLGEIVDAMSVDPRVTGILVTIRSMHAGMASASSLRAILARAHGAKKEVCVHLPMGAGSKEFLVATAATKIILGPRAQLAPLGFRTTARYVKPALERVGIEPQVFACGEFKSAGETLVRDSMSAQQRTQLERLLETFHRTLLDAIVDGRGVSRDRASELIDGAPYFGSAAVGVGLADGVAYEDEIPKRLGLERGRRDLVSAAGYLARAKRPLFRRVTRPPVVAVVPIHGPITHAAGLFEALSTDERVTRSIRAVRRDRRVVGVILHVDSPGGSALASDRMHHEIEQLAREKPVVVCMANVAASGGYYVAAPAACIVAQATTVTGSIGVVAARISLDPLLARLGIRTEVVQRGAHATLLSAVGPLDEDLRTAVMRELDATYRAFVGVVAAGREMAEDEVERLARGRVYTGEDALEAKLVDVLGGFDVALAELKKRLAAPLRDQVEVRLTRVPRHPRPVPEPPNDEDAARKAARAIAAVALALLPPRERLLVELTATGERVLAVASITET